MLMSIGGYQGYLASQPNITSRPSRGWAGLATGGGQELPPGYGQLLPEEIAPLRARMRGMGEYQRWQEQAAKLCGWRPWGSREEEKA